MTSTASAPLLSVAAAAAFPTSTPTTQGAAPLDHAHGVAEVEAWLLEVAPIVAALGQAPTVPSPGQQRWLVRLAHDALQALDLVEGECAEAEAHGEPTDHAEWLHTRVSATLDGARSLLVEQHAAA